MKNLYVSLLVLFFSQRLSAQNEFKTYDNGLIYSKEIILKLSTIVDSLNLKHKVCDVNKVFYGKSQTIGHKIYLDTLNVLAAKKDLEAGISFDSFIKKYPFAKIERDFDIIKFKNKDYQNVSFVEYNQLDPSHGFETEIAVKDTFNAYEKPHKNTWVLDYNKKSQYSEESVTAFYFVEEFQSKALSPKYSRMVGYSDCLIDTATTKFKEETKSGWVELPKNWQTLSDKKQKKLLDDMRSTRVVGFCSMDSRPRQHAINIALLSAETLNWEVFLKSHLDIMNDRFDRMSDGSYAWANRKTYIKELEELNINVSDLMLGIALRVENPAHNHYFGSIQRLGRAIAESKNKEAFESEMLSMVEDSTLDNFNRVLTYFLFLNYNNSLPEPSDRDKNRERLKNSVAKFPEHIKNKIDWTQK